MPPLVNSPGTRISPPYLNVVLRVRGYRACVFYALNIISIVEMLGHGCWRDLLLSWSIHRKIPILAHLFPF